MKTSTAGHPLYVAAGLGCIFAAQVASADPAQTPADTGVALTPATATAAAAGDALETIVVTATKRAENLQSVPLTVDVVSQAALQNANLSNTADLVRLSPGLEFRHTGTPANDAFNIRGIETLASSYGVEQSVGVAFDGVPLARPAGAVADLVDVRNVEILKGPQGMLFGKNASAGLINIVTNSPQLNTNDTTLRASFGSLNERQYSATVNLAVTEDSAMRVSAWKFSHDGTIHEENTGQYMNNQDTGGARFKYRWQPSEDLNINFTGEWDSHDQNGPGYSIRTFEPGFFTANNSGAAIEAYELAHGTSPGDANRTSRGLNESYYDKGRTDAYTAQADYSVGQGTVTTIVSYRNIKSNDSFDPYPSDNPYSQEFKNTDDVAYNQLSEEIHYASPVTDRIHYVVGVFNFRLKLAESLGFGINAGPALVLADANFDEGLKNNNYAGFGEATFDVTSKLHFIAGIRRSTDQLYASMNRYGANTASLGGLFATSTSTEYNDISWRTGLQYEITPDVMAYGTVSRGYKGPGIGYQLSTTAANLAAANNGIVKPEIVHAYEIGLKSQWFDHRLTANIAVYQEVFDDFQTSVSIPSAPFTIVAIENAGQAKSTGVDLTAGWAVTRSFSVTASATYDNARYTDFKNASCYTGQSLAQGCSPAGLQNLSGHYLADTPKTSVNLTGRFEHPINSLFTGFVQLNGDYKSAVNFSSLGDPLSIQKQYTVFNADAGVNTSDGRWSVSVYGKNLLDKHYVDNIVSNGSGNTILFNDIGYEDLQTFGIAVTAHF